jgi:hypothetical protein
MQKRLLSAAGLPLAQVQVFSLLFRQPLRAARGMEDRVRLPYVRKKQKRRITVVSARFALDFRRLAI